MKRDFIKKEIGILIESYFPRLRGKNFYVCNFNSKTYFGGAFWILPFLRLIFINFKKLNRKESELVLVHELTHFNNYGCWLNYIVVEIFYWINPKFRREEEIKVEKYLVKKDFARDIYKFNKKYKNKNSRYHLAPEEIKKYAIGIKKW